MSERRIAFLITSLFTLAIACNFPGFQGEAVLQDASDSVAKTISAVQEGVEKEMETEGTTLSTPTPSQTPTVTKNPTLDPSASPANTLPPPTATKTSTSTPTETSEPTATIHIVVLPTLPPAQQMLTSFSASYHNHHFCPGDVATVVFAVTNTGDTILESTQIQFADLDDASMFWTRTSNNPFSASAGGCPKDTSKLGPGVSAYVIVQIPLAASYGHTYRANIRLCTAENVGGYCALQIVTYVMQHP